MDRINSRDKYVLEVNERPYACREQLVHVQLCHMSSLLDSRSQSFLVEEIDGYHWFHAFKVKFGLMSSISDLGEW